MFVMFLFYILYHLINIVCFICRIFYSKITLYALMDSSFWFDTINFGLSIVYVKPEGITGYNFKIFFFISFRNVLSYQTV